MFWERFLNLCNEIGKSPNALAKELSISSGSITAWKNGTIPQDRFLNKLATHFDVSVEYLLGNTDEKKPAIKNDSERATETDDNTIIVRGRDGSCIKKTLTDEQIKMLQAMIESLPEAPDDL